MKKELIGILADYAKRIPCMKEEDNYSCDGRCLLEGISYRFNMNGNTYQRNLCHLITHLQDVRQFKKHLQDARIKLLIEVK